MSNKHLLVLGLVAMFMVTLAVYQTETIHSRTQSPQRKTFQESYLIQGLDLEAIASIQIGTGEDPITFVRRGQQFVITSKDDYPADTGKINTLLVDLADLRIAEFVTDNSENYASLKVAEENAENRITLFDQHGEIITGVIVGSKRVVEGATGPSQTYVRLLSGPNVYLVEQFPLIASSALDFMNKELVAVETEEIEKVTASLPESNEYTLTTESNDGQTFYGLADIPEGKQIAEDGARTLFSAFNSITFQDVSKEENFAEDVAPAGSVTCYLTNEIAYTFNILKGEEKSYARVRAEYLDTTPIVKENRVESDEELKAKEARLLARDTAESFTKLHSGWLYEIPQWKADTLLKAREDLLEDIAPAEESAPADSSEPSTGN